MNDGHIFSKINELVSPFYSPAVDHLEYLMGMKLLQDFFPPGNKKCNGSGTTIDVPFMYFKMHFSMSVS